MGSRAVALVVACLLAPASAGAATRYVSPGGAASGACERDAPCSVGWAVNGGGSAPGDTVVVSAGTYVDQPLVVGRELTITAAPEAPRPVFRTTAAGAAALTVDAGAAGAVIERLAIRAAGPGGVAVEVGAAVSLDDLRVVTATAPCLRSDAKGLRIDDSTFAQSGASEVPCLQTSGNDTSWTGVTVTAFNAVTAAAYAGNGEVVDGTFTGQATGLELGGRARVHRVTATGRERGIALLGGATMVTDSVAIARAGGSAVLAAGGAHQLLNVTAWGDGAGAYGVRAVNGADLTVRNTIARGGARDLSADPAPTAITAECAVFTGCPAGRVVAGQSNFRTGQNVVDAGGNQARSPRFADPEFEDFRLRRGSPAIDAGSFELNSGSADRDGRFRWLGKRPDIGAYEYPSPRKPKPRADRKAPSLGVVRLSPARFRAGRRGVAFSAARRAPAGSTLVYVVSEDADLVIQVLRPGRAGSLGTIVRPAARGTHRTKISGRVDGRPLPPGRYVMTVIARDVAQNLSRPRRLAFTVVR